MNSEKVYVYLQAFAIFVTLVYTVFLSGYVSTKENYNHPIICGIGLDLVALFLKVAEYFVIKLFTNILTFIFKFNIDATLSLKIVTITYAFITLIDTIVITMKYLKEKRIQA